jgi:cobalt-zinc-cadmium efflux system membrane fusion protein
MKRLLTLLFSGRVSTVALIIVLVVAGLTWNRWWPVLNEMADRVTSRKAALGEATSEEAIHEDHVDAPAASGTAGAFLDLSPEAMKNLGLTSDTVRPIELQTYRKTISVPAIIVERPGQTLMQISTPMTGVVTEVAAIEGSAVEPGQRLFRIRLTHEDLVQSQIDFVKSLGELDVEEREIVRLEPISKDTPKLLLERKYAKEKLEALLSAQREALRLHGLSQRQIEQIAKERRLLSELTIAAPSAKQHSHELELTANPILQPIALIVNQEAASDPSPEPEKALAAQNVPLVVESLKVQRGQSVEQGGQLCVLADYSQLYVEGLAFEQDVDAINKAATASWKITALLPGGGTLKELALSFVASEIDPESRTLKFYVDLPNEILRDTKNAAGRRFLTWRFKPGQRLQLQVPVEELPNQIVLPLDAVANEGVESFVFQRKGKQRFDRIAVHVLHRDQTSVVVANDGALFAGDVVALRGAHQLQMAVKNKSGGAIDPHAGHSH